MGALGLGMAGAAALLLAAAPANDLDVATSHGRVRVMGDTEGQHWLEVDGKTVMRDTESMIDVIQSVDEDAAHGVSYVLVQRAAAGGMNCPAMYQVLELSRPDAVQVSPVFGTCSDLARASVGPGGGLRVLLPHLDGSGDSVFVFQDGKLAEDP